MNTIKYLTIIILAFLSVQCCEKNIQGNAKRITIDLEERTETSVFDLTDSITVVPLHTSDSCLIATINQIDLKSASNLNGNLNCSKELEHYAS